MLPQCVTEHPSPKKGLRIDVDSVQPIGNEDVHAPANPSTLGLADTKPSLRYWCRSRRAVRTSDAEQT